MGRLTKAEYENREEEGCEYCNERNMPLWWNNAGHPSETLIEPNFCPMCGKKLTTERTLKSLAEIKDYIESHTTEELLDLQKDTGIKLEDYQKSDY